MNSILKIVIKAGLFIFGIMCFLVAIAFLVFTGSSISLFFAILGMICTIFPFVWGKSRFEIIQIFRHAYRKSQQRYRESQEKSTIERERRAREREHLGMIRKEEITRETARLEANQRWKTAQREREEMRKDPFGINRSQRFWRDLGFPTRKKKR